MNLQQPQQILEAGIHFLVEPFGNGFRVTLVTNHGYGDKIGESKLCHYTMIQETMEVLLEDFKS